MKYWIFDPINKAWYTPEEFLDKFERLVRGSEAMLKQVIAKDPVAAIKEAREVLSILITLTP